MNHHEIKQREIVERYVQHQLAADERLAFQEHYFACDQCFDEVQETARFIAGVKDASATGVLGASRVQTASSSWFGWFNPALALSIAASLLLAVLVAWLWFWKVPAYQQQVAHEQQSRAESEKKLEAARNQAEESQRQLEVERAERARPAEGLPAPSQNNDLQRPGPDVIAQANVPMVTLESTRDSQSSGSQLTVPSDAKSVALLIPVEPGNRFSGFRVQISTRGGQIVATINKRGTGRNGVLNVVMPAKTLAPGRYLVKLYGSTGHQTELLGDYDLTVVTKQ